MPITPPNSQSKKGSNNVFAGRRAIESDVRKVFVQRNAAPAADPREYERYRNRRGRVGRSLGKARIAVSDLKEFIRERQAKVGILASGWNAAAVALGVRLPGWITRHGTRRGAVRIILDRDEMSITIRNAVGFGGNVNGLYRRIQYGLNRRARQIHKQLDNYELAQAAREAGL